MLFRVFSFNYIKSVADPIPVVSNAKAIYEAAVGKDPFTGRKLEAWERGASAASILGGPIVKGIKHGGKAAAGIIKNGSKSTKKTTAASKPKDTTTPSQKKQENKPKPNTTPAPAGNKKQTTSTPQNGNKPAAAKQQGTDKSTIKGTGKETYQHLKDYKNNKYFTRSVEYNAGKDGTGFTYKVYQREDINWDMVRTKGAKKGRGLTNAEASAKYGLAPILDEAGSVATLHHSQQKGVGPLYEASTRYHNIANAKRAPLHPYKGKLNPFYPMDETTRGAFQKVDSINYWKIRGEEALGGR